MDYVLVTLAVFGLVTFVHELGHAVAAAFFRFPIITFAVGFGKPLFERRVKNTVYRLGVFPLGGYIRTCLPDEGKAQLSSKARLFSLMPVTQSERDLLTELERRPELQKKPPRWQICSVYLAGPLASVLLAFSISGVVFPVLEAVNFHPRIALGPILRGGPLHLAHVRPGDIVMRINGREITSFKLYRRMVRKSRGRRLRVELVRYVDERPVPITVYVKSAYLYGHWDLGVKFVWRIPYYPPELREGLISLVVNLRNAYERSARDILYEIETLSWVLGILNLLPLPLLDGGEFLLHVTEGATKRDVPLHLKKLARKTVAIAVHVVALVMFLNELHFLLSL